MAERLQAAGYAVEFDYLVAPVTRFYTHDPLGNRLEFADGPSPAQP